MYFAIIDNYIITACPLIISKPTFVVAFCEFWLYNSTFLTLPFFLLLMENFTHHWLHFVLQVVFQSNDIYVQCIIKNHSIIKITEKNELYLLYIHLFDKVTRFPLIVLPSLGLLLNTVTGKKLHHSQYRLVLWPDDLNSRQFHDTVYASPISLF